MELAFVSCCRTQVRAPRAGYRILPRDPPHQRDLFLATEAERTILILVYRLYIDTSELVHLLQERQREQPVIHPDPPLRPPAAGPITPNIRP